MDAVFDHVSRYGNERKAAEGITELLTQIAKGNIYISDLPQTRRSKIIYTINKLLDALGIIGKPSDIAQLAQDIKTAFETGDTTGLEKQIANKGIDKEFAEKDKAALGVEEKEISEQDYIGRSKSERADEAEKKGLRSLSKIDNTFSDKVNTLIQKETGENPNLTSNKIKELFKGEAGTEWHHTGPNYKKTDYFNPDDIANRIIADEKITLPEEYQNLRDKQDRLNDKINHATIFLLRNFTDYKYLSINDRIKVLEKISQLNKDNKEVIENYEKTHLVSSDLTSEEKEKYKQDYNSLDLKNKIKNIVSDVLQNSNRTINEADKNNLETPKKSSILPDRGKNDNNNESDKRGESTKPATSVEGQSTGRPKRDKLNQLVEGGEHGEKVYSTIKSLLGQSDTGREGGRGNEGNRASESDRQKSWNKQSFLRDVKRTALRSGSWIENIHDIIGEYIKSGDESDVYKSKDGKSVIKINNFNHLDNDDSHLFTNDFEGFLDRIKSHNEFAPDEAYKIKGFTENAKGEVSAVLEQPRIKNAEYAPLKDIFLDLKDRGFDYKRLTDGGMGFTDGKYEITDVKPENVLMDKEGNLHYVDAEIQSVAHMESKNMFDHDAFRDYDIDPNSKKSLLQQFLEDGLEDENAKESGGNYVGISHEALNEMSNKMGLPTLEHGKKIWHTKAAFSNAGRLSSSSLYFGNNRMEEIRMYAMGKQPVNKYKKLLTGTESTDSSWMNIDWSVIHYSKQYAELNRKSIHSVKLFGDFDNTTSPHKNILKKIEEGKGLEAYAFVERIKILKELSKI